MILRTLLGEAISINIPVIFLRTDSWFSSLEQNCFQTTITRINEQTNKLFYFSTINNQQSTINNQQSTINLVVWSEMSLFKARLHASTNKRINFFIFQQSTINNQQSIQLFLVKCQFSNDDYTHQRINESTFLLFNNPTIQQSNNPTIQQSNY
jgi:hypothetical protein